jgi:hypothetical protein
MCTTLRYELPCGFYQRRHDKKCEDPDCTTKTLVRLVLLNGCAIWKYHVCPGSPTPTSIVQSTLVTENHKVKSSVMKVRSSTPHVAASIRSSTIETGLESDDDSLYVDPTPKRRASQMNDGKAGQPRATCVQRERVCGLEGWGGVES